MILHLRRISNAAALDHLTAKTSNVTRSKPTRSRKNSMQRVGSAALFAGEKPRGPRRTGCKGWNRRLFDGFVTH
jgi:hypothetical protein